MDLDVPNDHQQQSDSSSSYAPQACASCRKQKRKCDKLLPTCSLCQRIGRTCVYTPESDANAPSAEDFAALRQKVLDLESVLSNNSNGGSSNGSNGTTHVNPTMSPLSVGSSPHNLLGLSPSPGIWPGTSSFPSMFFLDSDLFEHERFQIQSPYIKVPPGALNALGNSAQLRSMIETYFATVHNYFPIVSKIRLYQHLSNPLHEPGADLALLFLAMKLTASEVPLDCPPQTQLYLDVKSFFSYVESQNGFSIQLIQACLLVSLYELGHGIYPACYLSIGHAARLGYAMGVHERGAPQMLSRPNTWTEQEERRRVWWAVIVLDRFVSIGNRRKPFAASDPSLDNHLPTEDGNWDRGQMIVGAPLALSASSTIHAAPFARTCQSAHLLGKILRHLSDKNLPTDYRFTEAMQLHRTMRALAGVLPAEAEQDDPTHRPTLCTSMAICYSGLLSLYDAYSCTERHVENAPETQLIMQKEAIEGLGEISEQAFYLVQRVRGFAERDGLARVSPLVIDALYQCAANYAWYHRESSSAESLARLTEVKEALALLNQRWRIAGEYVKVIEATEFHIASVISEGTIDMSMRPLCDI